ncbi:MAG: hypothetical protein LBT32_05085, partial [Peptococcaceae bacterium]|nr:hypothetical protein [Peptococcaceae bacterium]
MKKLITLLTVAVMICGSAIATVAAPLPTTALVNSVTPHYLPGSVEYSQIVSGGPIQTAGDYATFKKLVQDNTTTTIYLTADIVQTKSDYAPIALKKANSQKPLLVIDGNGFTITEYSGATTGGFIAFKLDKTVTALTVQNLIIKGFNRDGFIRAEDTNKVERVVTFDNVTYVGRSIADLASASGHVGETLVLKDCVIESSKAAGTTINRQVGDAHNIILEGTIQIKRDNNAGASDNYGIFRVRGDYLTVKSGAVVNIVNDTVGGL